LLNAQTSLQASANRVLSYAEAANSRCAHTSLQQCRAAQSLFTHTSLLTSASLPAARLHRRLADVASAVLLVLTTVPAETARAVAVTGAGTGDLLWDSPVGQLARAAQRSWAELTVDLPKVRSRPWQFLSTTPDSSGWATAVLRSRARLLLLRNFNLGERGTCTTLSCRAL